MSSQNVKWVLRLAVVAMTLAAIVAGSKPAVRAQGPVLYVADFAASGVIALDTASGAMTPIVLGPPFVDPWGIAVDAAGQIVVADANAGTGTSGAVFRMNPSTTVVTTVYSGAPTVSPTGIRVGPDGNYYFADISADAIFRVDAGSGAIATLKAGAPLVDPIDVEFASSHLYIADRGADPDAMDGEIFKLDLSSGSITTVSSGMNLADPSGLTEGPDGALYVTDRVGCGGVGCIVKVDPVTGTQTVVSTGYSHAVGIVFSPTGKLFVDEFEASTVSSVALVGGTKTTVFSGSPLKQPAHIVFAPPVETNPGVPSFTSGPAAGSVVAVPVLGMTALGATIKLSASDPDTAQKLTIEAAGLPSWASLETMPGNPASATITSNPDIFTWALAAIGGGLSAVGINVPWLPAMNANVLVTVRDNGSPANASTRGFTLRLTLFATS